MVTIADETKRNSKWEISVWVTTGSNTQECRIPISVSLLKISNFNNIHLLEFVTDT